jgi:hypothetical protein
MSLKTFQVIELRSLQDQEKGGGGEEGAWWREAGR